MPTLRENGSVAIRFKDLFFLRPLPLYLVFFSTACRQGITTMQLQISEMFIFAKKKKYSRGETPNSGVRRPHVPAKTPAMQFQWNINDLKYLLQYDDSADQERRRRVAGETVRLPP